MIIIAKFHSIKHYSVLIPAVYFEQKEYEKCIAECEKGIEVGRENRADFKFIAKAFQRIGNAYKKLEVSIFVFEGNELILLQLVGFSHIFL